MSELPIELELAVGDDVNHEAIIEALDDAGFEVTHLRSKKDRGRLAKVIQYSINNE
jgi:hypothetical protein